MSGHVQPWLPEADDQNRTMLRAAASTAVALSDGGYDTGLEGVVGPWILDVSTAALGPNRHVDYIGKLTLDPTTDYQPQHPKRRNP